MSRPDSAEDRALLVPWAVFVVFVVYGSLVPLDWRAMPVSEALRRFARTPWLSLGVASRADWIANLVLYVPVAYGAAYFWVGRRSGASARGVASVGVLVFCLALALGVEFAQLFFPPRTVSLNDFLAEGLGSLLGLGLFLSIGERVRSTVRGLFADGGRAVRAALLSYAAAYSLYALFPFDFLVSAGEFKQKLAIVASHSLWLTPGVYDGPIHLLLKPFAEVGAAAPLGALAAALGLGRRRLGPAVLLGIAVGVGIEAVQFFLASGVTEGAAAVAKAVGFVLGYEAFCITASRLARGEIAEFPHWLVPAAAVAYLSLLVPMNWARRGGLLPLEEVLRRAAKLSLIPFYYHYYLPESRALFSAAGYFALYAPCGVLVQLARNPWGIAGGRGDALAAVLTGAVLAAALEFGKLFLSAARPDFTNVLLAAMGAWAGAKAAEWASRLWVRARKTMRGRVLAGRDQGA